MEKRDTYTFCIAHKNIFISQYLINQSHIMKPVLLSNLVIEFSWNLFISH